MAASGTLSTLGVVELLQIAALFKKMGSLRLTFAGDRVLTVFFQEGHLSGLTDSGGVWQLGDLLTRMGRLREEDRDRMLVETRLRGKRLGQLVLENGYVSRHEMEGVLRKLIMQSLLYAVENEQAGRFQLDLGAACQTSVMLPITDFLIELMSAVDELQRLRRLLGPGGSALALDPSRDLTDVRNPLTYRRVQVLAHVDSEKSPMDIAACSPLTPTETLRILCELATLGLLQWRRGGQGAAETDLAPVLRLPDAGRRERPHLGGRTNLA